MEQRIGPSSQPLDGAGIDPAFIPGLTSPVSAERDSDEPEDAVPDGVKAAAVESVEPAESAESVKPAESDGGASEEETAADDAGADDAEAEEKAPEGPVFEAADRRARIVADHTGVRLRLDDQECEFRWDEIGAVETQAARFGKRFTVTVHTPDRRWYPIEIEATARARFTEWETRLDEVLDAYFEDGEKEPAAAQDGD
ncbi:hypothetical protein [Streptomyces gibsoniae]|uniref:Uncharacterized protein n=1 Tax=Streptomyces gibsoniae TaxID=3075529 RepID=A0ABU2U1N4_9ACTN|nr:hypothetical protein [Streptomyces sp. DSM 41699]MDT0467126.1 hypothetical protein [Streptomyces sp. DSM 41699]